VIIFVCFRFHNDECGMAPFFVFGDFNFRADTQGVVKVSRSFFFFPPYSVVLVLEWML